MEEIEMLFTKHSFFMLDSNRIYVTNNLTIEENRKWGNVLYLRNVLLNENESYRASMFWLVFKDLSDSNGTIMLPTRPEVIMSYTFKDYW